MRRSRVAHSARQTIGQPPRVSKSDARQQRGPVRRQTPPVGLFRGQSRVLRPHPGKKRRRHGTGRDRHDSRMQHPTAADRSQRRGLIEITRIARTPGRP